MAPFSQPIRRHDLRHHRKRSVNPIYFSPVLTRCRTVGSLRRLSRPTNVKGCGLELDQVALDLACSRRHQASRVQATEVTWGPPRGC